LKFLKAEDDNLLFQIGRREKNLLFELLKLYPLTPPAQHKISGSINTPEMEANQHLLEEALAEQRQDNKKQLDAMLQEPNRFQESPTGFRFRLSPCQLEWLLQVLNDIRVGSWLQLGSPDEKRGKRLRLSLQNARYIWAMELSGHFQYVLLSAKDAS
jgi:hypothetical protein